MWNRWVLSLTVVVFLDYVFFFGKDFFVISEVDFFLQPYGWFLFCFWKLIEVCNENWRENPQLVTCGWHCLSGLFFDWGFVCRGFFLFWYRKEKTRNQAVKVSTYSQCLVSVTHFPKLLISLNLSVCQQNSLISVFRGINYTWVNLWKKHCDSCSIAVCIGNENHVERYCQDQFSFRWRTFIIKGVKG